VNVTSTYSDDNHGGGSVCHALPRENRLRPDSPAQKAHECEDRQPGDAAPLPSHSHASVCSFRRICDDNKIRLIKVHHFRHTVGSLLKDLGVPARDAQTILGHTRVSTTLEIYTDTDEQARRDAVTRLQSLLGEAQN